MAVPTFVQGNTAPDINATIKADGVIKNLTSCTVRFQMRKTDDRRFTVNAAATVTNAPLGQVRYTWGPNDLVVPGEYQVQWQVTYPDAKKQTTDPPNPVTIRRE